MSGRRNLPYVIIGLFAVFSLAVYVAKPDGKTTQQILSNLVSSGSAAAAFITAFVASRKHDDLPSMGWSLVTIGLGLFLLGEMSWGFQEIILGISVPFPSIADLFWLLGYVPLSLGLLSTWRQLQVGLGTAELIVIIIVAIAVFVLASALLLVPIAVSPDATLLEKALYIGYPLEDLIILVPAVSLVLIFGRTPLGRPWRFICAGLVLIALADLAFAYLSWRDLYGEALNRPGNLIDLIWAWGYLAIALGAVNYSRLIDYRKVHESEAR